jgi:hypothetical protein
MLDLFRLGIPKSASHDATFKLRALATYAGMSERIAAEFFSKFLEREGHRALHCQTPAGRRQRMAEFRSAGRHQARGVAAGNVREGGLADPRLWSAIANVLGRRYSPRKSTRAALAKWGGADIIQGDGHINAKRKTTKRASEAAPHAQAGRGC